MIQTSITKVKISEVVQGQIPQYIDSENPLFAEFLKQYYVSQEFQGGSVDIADNLKVHKTSEFVGFATFGDDIGVAGVSTFVGETNIGMGQPHSLNRLILLQIFVISKTSKTHNFS